MHPFIDASSLTDNELQEKINELYKKIRMTQNPEVQHQIQLALQTFQEEQMNRYRKNIENNEEFEKYTKNISIE